MFKRFPVVVHMFVTTSVAQQSNFVAKPILKYVKLYLDSPDTKKYKFIARIFRKFFLTNHAQFTNSIFKA